MLSTLLYKAGISLYSTAAKALALLGKPKPKAFIEGRENLFTELKAKMSKIEKPVIWFHCSSLGEFEQARPLIEDINRHHRKYAILLSFFSPSGYDQRKDYTAVDMVSYLPIDTAANAEKWMNITNPILALFAKYDLWYYHLQSLYKREIPIMLFSAVFRPGQIFFKPYGQLHRKMLGFFRKIFVQDVASEKLLAQIGISNVSVCGDTRIDSVAAMAKSPKKISSIANMTEESPLLIAGSTWPPDIEVILQAFVQIRDTWKLVIVPHDVSEASIAHLQHACSSYRVGLLSRNPDTSLLQVLIIDSIGLLGSAYQYGSAAYVGGGFATGLHSTLEPAAYGLSIFFGPEYHKFVEAKEMIEAGAALSIRTGRQLAASLVNKEKLATMGQLSAEYIQNHQGATRQILRYLFSEKYLSTAP